MLCERENPIQRYVLLEYVLVCLLFWSSGNATYQTIFGGSRNASIITLLVMVLILFFKKEPCKQTNKTISIYLFFILLEFYHYMIGAPLVSCIGGLIRITTGWLVVFFQKEFMHLYVRTIVVLTIISLFMWLNTILGNNLKYIIISFLPGSSDGYTIIHTFHPRGDVWYRNCSIFWEPGAFAGYLILGLIFQHIISQKTFSKKAKMNMVIIIIGILTTFSTMGYIALFSYIILLQTTKHVKKKLPINLFAIILFGVFSAYAFYSLPFLNEKISKELDSIKNESYNWRITRVGSIISDYEMIAKHPILGSGYNYSAMGYDETLKAGMGNGFSDFVLKNGLLGFLLWTYGVLSFLSISGNKKQIIGLLLILMLTLQGEMFLNYPLYLSLMFLGTPSQQNDNETIKR